MTEAELARIRATADPSASRIEVVPTEGGLVLVKRPRAARAAWHGDALNALTRVAGLDVLQAAPSPGGVAGQRLEATRLRALRGAGLAVPALLHEEDAFIVMQHVKGESLVRLIEGEATLAGGTQARRVDAGIAMAWWQRGLDTLAAVHVAGQYLSQAFARNFIATDDELWMIDFEDDPLIVMSLDDAQARDWLTYLYSSAWLLPVAADCTAAVFGAAIARERAPVRAAVEAASRRLAWLRHLPRQRKPWGREVVSLQALGAVCAAGLATTMHTS